MSDMTEARHAKGHKSITGSRWMELRNRRQEGAAYRDEWYAEQCGMCEYWIPLAGVWGLDWGGCSNPRSPFDGTIRTEHDGCDEFSSANDWGQPEDFSRMED